MTQEKIPDTFLEALSLATLLSEVLGYDQDRMAIAVDGTDLHVGVPDEKLHFLAGPLPPDCVGSSHGETESLTEQAWKRSVQAFNLLEPPERHRLVLASKSYHRRHEMAIEIHSLGIVPPRLLS